MAFFTVPMKRSTSAFARGHSGVILQCLKPVLAVYRRNSSLLKGGPVSDFMTEGIHLRVRMPSSLGMTVDAEVELITSTNGNLLYSSTNTIRYWPFGKWPKSMLSSVQGTVGSGDICNGSLCVLGVAT